jgi:phosphoglycolate phosphatase-like HAD superfamily hydrolase
MRTVIFDIDGTLANGTHRQRHLTAPKKDWDAFYAAMGEDTAIQPIIDLANQLACDYHIVLCTGRPSNYREVTERWLYDHDVPRSALYMRAEGDFRDDTIVKREMLAQMREAGFEPWLVVDDRTKVVRMWREEGLVCLQCAEGDF